MDASIVIQGIGLGAVALLAFWDMRAVERSTVTRRAYARPSATDNETRCPFCRRDFEESREPKARCASCATPHHAECWSENGGCTIFGCGSVDTRQGRVTIEHLEVEIESAPADAEADATPSLAAETAPCG
jgi:hypothetical protein